MDPGGEVFGYRGGGFVFFFPLLFYSFCVLCFFLIFF